MIPVFFDSMLHIVHIYVYFNIGLMVSPFSRILVPILFTQIPGPLNLPVNNLMDIFLNSRFGGLSTK
jgi:hypothetical protein